MILIAHRGNLYGRQPERENSPEYLNEAINQGYHVLADTWYYDHCFWFGFHHPKDTSLCYKPHVDWLPYAMNSVLLRARNPEALIKANELGLNAFWHQTDSYSLTTWGDLLGFYGAPACGESFVCMMPHRECSLVDDQYLDELSGHHDQYALCSDHAGSLVEYLNRNPALV